MKFSSIEEVIKRVNWSHYNLEAGLVTKYVVVALKIAIGLNAGSIIVRCFDKSGVNTTFGGLKTPV